MELNSLNQLVYLVSEENGTYFFTTEQGTLYQVYFTEADGYAPSASFAKSLLMVGFAKVPGLETKQRSDSRIAKTILDLLYRFFLNYPEIILLFLCSDESAKHKNPDEKIKQPRFAKKRSEIFSAWFDRWQQTEVMPIEKIDYSLYGQIYASCLFRSGHPYETEIRQLIERTILEKQPS